MFDQKAIIETKFGPRELTATSATHVYVGPPGYVNGSAPLMKGVGLRGTEWHVSAHLYKWSDGTWHIGPNEGIGYNYDVLDRVRWEQAPFVDDRAASDFGQIVYRAKEENHGSLYAWRGILINANLKQRAILGAAIEDAVNEWAKTGGDVLKDAEHNRLRTELDNAKAVVEEARKAYNTAVDQQAKAQAALVDFEAGAVTA